MVVYKVDDEALESEKGDHTQENALEVDLSYLDPTMNPTLQ